MEYKKFAKALIPLAIGAVVLVLNQFGITTEMTLEEVVTLLIATAGGVYLTPNKK